jgi:hypothetical protein
MKKIHLRGVSETLCESEMKDVRGGEGFDTLQKSDERQVDGGGNNGTGNCYSLRPCNNDSDWAACSGRLCGDACYNSNLERWGKCIWILAGWNACKTCVTSGFGI